MIQGGAPFDTLLQPVVQSITNLDMKETLIQPTHIWDLDLLAGTLCARRRRPRLALAAALFCPCRCPHAAPVLLRRNVAT